MHLQYILCATFPTRRMGLKVCLERLDHRLINTDMEKIYPLRSSCLPYENKMVLIASQLTLDPSDKNKLSHIK